MNNTSPPPCKDGDRIELLNMPNDPHPVPAGTKGIVLAVRSIRNDEWQIAVIWDNGRTLALIHPVDNFRIL